jgi:membrane protein YqaA with SNARE-associated domain
VAVDAAEHPMSPLRALVPGALDVPLVVIAAVVAIAAGAPVLGSVIGAGVWLLNRVVAVVDRRWADGLRTRRQQVTVTLFERFGRIWLLAIGIIVSGVVGGRKDGLTTALFVFGAYSVAFVIKLFSGPPEPKGDS